MAVKMWKPDTPFDHPSEGAALLKLEKELGKSKQQFWIFPSIMVNGSQIDFLIFSKAGLFIIELKHTDGQPIQGGVNGAWTRQDGVSYGEHNPVKQIIRQYQSLRDWLQKNQCKFLTPNQVKSLRKNQQGTFADIKKFIVLYPAKHPQTRLDLKDEQRIHPAFGDVIGFDQLVSCLENPAWQSQFGIEFNEQIVAKIANLLGLKTNSSEEQKIGKTLPTKNSRGLNRWMWSTISLSIVVLVALAVFFGGTLTQKTYPTYRTQEANKHIDEIAFVRAYIHNVGLFDEAEHSVFLYANNFTVQIDDVTDPQKDLKDYQIWQGKCVLVGPRPIKRSKEGNPQITLKESEARTLINESDETCSGAVQ